MKNILDLSIIITSSSEGITIHKSILSAIAETKNSNFKSEIILHIDNPSASTIQYIDTNNDFLLENSVVVLKNTFYDINLSRNYSLSKSNGKYVIFLTAGDLLSSQYLSKSLELLESKDYGRYVTYCDTIVGYYNEPYNSPIIQPSNTFTNFEIETLLNVFDCRWKSSLIFPKNIFEDFEYTPCNSNEYDPYQWHIICELIDKRITLEKIPRTCYYTKDQLQTHTFNRFILPKTKLLLPSNIKSIELVDEFTKHKPTTPASRRLKNTVKDKLKSYPIIVKSAQHSLEIYHNMRSRINNISAGISFSTSYAAPSWLLKDAQLIHKIEPRVFIYPEYLKGMSPLCLSNQDNNYKFGLYYKIACSHLTYDKYDYLLVVPWLIEGGADMFFINYANAIAKLRPDKHILVISTNPLIKSVECNTSKLSDSIDFLPIAEIINSDIDYSVFCLQMIKLLVEQLDVEAVHIANSLLGFKFITEHKSYLESKNISIVATAYNEVISKFGQRQGYVHEYIPLCYNQVKCITTDNQAIIDLWENEYGMDKKKMILHHQPFNVPEVARSRKAKNNTPVRLLWASRIKKEKRPETVVAIAKQFANTNDVLIDCYGAPEKGHYSTNPLVNKSLKNLNYRGGFKSFFDDINLNEYDAIIYTSMFDGTPNILIEAGLAKLPIISTAIGGIPNLVGKNASLIKNPESAEEFAAVIRKLIKSRHDFDVKADNLYKQLVKTQTYHAFENEIDQMLRIINY